MTTVVPACTPARDVGDGGVERAPVGRAVRVDHQRRHQRRPGRRPADVPAARVGRRPRSAAPPRSRARSGNGTLPAPHELDDALVDVAPDDLVPGVRDLHRQRQPDLAQRDDDRAHQSLHGLAACGRSRARPRRRRTVSSALLERDDAATSSPPDHREHRLELGEPSGSRLGDREARHVALGHAALLLQPWRRRAVAVAKQRQVGGQRVGFEHAALAEHARAPDLRRRDPVDVAAERDAAGEPPGHEHEVLVLAAHHVAGLRGERLRPASGRASARGRGRASRGP